MFGRLFGAKTPILDSLPEVRGKYIENAKLAKHTWFGVGGPAEVLFLPEDADDLKTFLMRKPAAIPVTGEFPAWSLSWKRRRFVR